MGHKKLIVDGRGRSKTGEKKTRAVKIDGEKNEKAIGGGKSSSRISELTQVGAAQQRTLKAEGLDMGINKKTRRKAGRKIGDRNKASHWRIKKKEEKFGGKDQF